MEVEYYCARSQNHHRAFVQLIHTQCVRCGCYGAE
jgi:hypothetical protein